MELYVNDSKLKAFLECEENDDFDEIIKFLEHKGIDMDLIDGDKIKEAIETQQRTLIAEGNSPIHGKDGSLNFLVDIDKLDKKNKPKFDVNEGKIDYRDISAFVFINEGQKIVKIDSSTNGKDGKNVYGEKIRAKDGKKVKIKFHNNIKRDDNYLISKVPGVLKYKGKTLKVKELLEIEKDVDYSVGNIDFNGNVVIKGDVAPDFKIKSGGDVVIKGVVDSAYIEADGEIIIEGGVHGHGESEIKSKTDITARFVNDAKLIAENIITIEKEALHSKLISRNKISASSIIGGEAVARNEIETNFVGADSLVKTRLIVGVDEKLESQFKAIVEKEKELVQDKVKLAKAIADLKSKEMKAQNKAAFKKKGKKVRQMLKRVKSNLKLIKKKKERLKSEKDDIGNGVIFVNKTIYSNVKIIIGQKEMKTDMMIEYVKFLKQNKQVKMYDMDEEISSKSKMPALIFVGSEEYDTELKKVNFKKDKVVVKNPSGLSIQQNDRLKVVFKYPQFGDTYEFVAEVKNRGVDEIVMKNISKVSRRLEKKPDVFYGNIKAEVEEIMSDNELVENVMINELATNYMYIISTFQIKKRIIFEIQSNLVENSFSAVINPYGNSIKMGEDRFETKFYFEKISDEDKNKIKKFIEEKM